MVVVAKEGGCVCGHGSSPLQKLNSTSHPLHEFSQVTRILKLIYMYILTCKAYTTLYISCVLVHGSLYMYAKVLNRNNSKTSRQAVYWQLPSACTCTAG